MRRSSIRAACFKRCKRHFKRYTPEMVEKVCGISPALFHRVADALTKASGPDKTAAICYAVGWTQHSKGPQIIRTAAILQLLLGNIGRPGGGIMALRGHASIQGSTDIPTLYDVLPGYLPMPRAGHNESTLGEFLKNHTNPTGLWHEFPAYFVSLLKAYYGTRATKENDFGYDWIPKITEDHSLLPLPQQDDEGQDRGVLRHWAEPGRRGQNARLERKALSKLKWLVVREMVEIETAAFWYNSPEIERGELKTEEIEHGGLPDAGGGPRGKGGRVYQYPAPAPVAREGGEPAGRLPQRGLVYPSAREAPDRQGGASADPEDEPLRALDWWYPQDDEGEPEDAGRAGRDQRLEDRARRRGEGHGLRARFAGEAASRPAARRVPRAQGRRLDRVRLLDLHGRASRATA